MPFSEQTVLHLSNNKATKLANVACAYCGGEDEPDNPLTEDHVIGRNFVPTGSFASGWSLILKACRRCNNEKSDLEDEISAITLQPDLGRGHDESTLAALAARKAVKSRSRLTKKTVADSYEEEVIEGKIMSAIDCRFGFTAPPRLAAKRLMRLARFHLQAFFYLITYDDSARLGAAVGNMGWVNDARCPDWGNALQRGFADFVSGWDSGIEGTGADGYFRIAIRRDPVGSGVWSFALEWNKALRSIGFFGDLEQAQAYVDLLPALEFQQLDATRRMRLEVPLDPEDDRLFLPEQEIAFGPKDVPASSHKPSASEPISPRAP